MTPERMNALLALYHCDERPCRYPPCQCAQNIEDAIQIAKRTAYEDAAKIAEKVGGHDLGDSYITPRIADAIRARAALELCEQNYERLEAERDKLKEEVERLTNLRHYNAEALWKQNDELATTNAALVERVSVLEKCLRFFASAIKSGEPWTETCQGEYERALARAALRTTEEGK
jgi:hypothetical protein